MYDVLTNCHVGIQPLPTMQSQPQPTKPINTTIGPSTLHVSTINHQPPTTIYQPSTTIYQPPTPIYQPPSINHHLSTTEEFIIRTKSLHPKKSDMVRSGRPWMWLSSLRKKIDVGLPETRTCTYHYIGHGYLWGGGCKRLKIIEG